MVFTADCFRIVIGWVFGRRQFYSDASQRHLFLALGRVMNMNMRRTFMDF